MLVLWPQVAVANPSSCKGGLLAQIKILQFSSLLYDVPQGSRKDCGTGGVIGFMQVYLHILCELPIQCNINAAA